MRIALIAGNWPPTACGIADYTRRLALLLEQAGAKISEIDYRNSRFFPANRSEFDIAHMQVPQKGYGKSVIAPALPFFMSRKRVVTLHEYRISSFGRRKSSWPFAMMDLRIFSNEAEMKYFGSEWRIRRGRDAIIPIGSNIPKHTGNIQREFASLCYFGLIMPGKGLEDFIAACRFIRKHQPVQISIIGSAPEKFKDYLKTIKAMSEEMSVDIHLDKSSAEVSELLSGHSFAYLPFPDGASEKRGSLIACWNNGVTVIAPTSRSTPEWMREAMLEAPTSKGAADAMIAALADERRIAKVRNLAEAAVMRFEWENIVRQHIVHYESLLTGRMPPAEPR